MVTNLKRVEQVTCDDARGGPCSRMSIILPAIRATLVLGAIFVGGTALADRDPAEALTIISKPRFGERSAVTRRFKTVLPEFARHCSDANRPSRVADMLARIYHELDNAGLSRQEGLPALTEQLLRLTSETARSARRAGAQLKCSELWAMYAVLRLQGWTPDDARRGVAQLVTRLYKLQ